MSERRVDSYTGRAVWIASSRRGLGATRPGGLPAPETRCPFCPGHESDTEPTIARWPNDGAWKTRVVANKYPLAPPHEVGIDAAEHGADLDTMEVDHVAGMLGLYRDRVRALEAASSKAVIVFRNRGRRAGSSQPHPHTQIVGLSEVPEEQALRARRARDAPLHEAELEREVHGERALWTDDHVAAFCPWASSRPYQVRLAPKTPRGGIGGADDRVIASLARLLVRAVAGIKRVGVADYNLIWRTPPVGEAGSWLLDVLPRTGGDAGFELASGERVVVVPPEEAAAALR